MVNVTTRGSLIGNSIEVAMELLEEMTTNVYQWPFEHNTLKILRVHELDVLTTLSSQVATLSK